MKRKPSIVSAVILCAGKGTRMNDNSINKVSFDCAGTPVIRRIVQSMKEGGVSRFAIVVGHQAQSVMDALDGVDGILYAYQKEQRGTGHAALCGLKALDSLGISGPVVISMGDKIIAPEILRQLLEMAQDHTAIFGAQPVANNFHGGRIVMDQGRPQGVVELADAAYEALAQVPSVQWNSTLSCLGLNAKKAAKVMAKAKDTPPSGSCHLCGKLFSAKDILASTHANAGLYCLDIQQAIAALASCRSDNAQGEIYLTDTMEYFALRDQAALLEIPSKEAMLTYSTKEELRAMSHLFLRPVSDYEKRLETTLKPQLEALYGPQDPVQTSRYRHLLQFFAATYGDRDIAMTRAPGRLNLMGRHIDHRGGSINVMAIGNDTLLAAAPRQDDTVRIANVDPAYPPASFSIGECLRLGPSQNWLEYLDSERVKEELRLSKGAWVNYVKSAVLRFQMASDMPLCGMDIAVSGTIPVAAGLSSSSSLVVATAEAVMALNSLNLTQRQFIELCGEGEWLVGSRGGAGDHGAMKCSQQGCITHLGFKPFHIGACVPFSNAYAVVVANSMTQAKKSEGSKDTFNAKVASYEFAFMILKRAFPIYNLLEFRDLANIQPASAIYRMLKTLPVSITRKEIQSLLPEYGERIKQIFASHSDPGTYDLRGVTLYGISECLRAEAVQSLLIKGNYAALGQLMKISHDGDRIRATDFSDAVLDALAAEEADPMLQCGAYGCSTPRIDALCDLLNATPGVLGSSLVGAGLGGCIIALIEKQAADSVISILNTKFYDKEGLPRSAVVYTPSAGSKVIY